MCERFAKQRKVARSSQLDYHRFPSSQLERTYKHIDPGTATAVQKLISKEFEYLARKFRYRVQRLDIDRSEYNEVFDSVLISALIALDGIDPSALPTGRGKLKGLVYDGINEWQREHGFRRRYSVVEYGPPSQDGYPSKKRTRHLWERCEIPSQQELLDTTLVR